MKKVLFVTPDFYPHSTGFANAAINLINAILKYGNDKYKIYVFTSVLLGDNAEMNNISVYRYQNNLMNHGITQWIDGLLRYKKIKSIISTHKIDIIFFETNTFPYLENFVVESYKDKVFVRIHSTLDTEIPVFKKANSFFEKINYYLMKRFMKKASNILSTSEYYIDFIKREYLHNNVFEIWNNKSYSLLCNTISEDIDPEEQMISSNIFTTLGKMSEPGIIQKGITDLLKAIYFLKADEALPEDFLLNIIGDGDSAEKLKKYGTILEVENVVSFKGNVSHESVLNYIRASKVIILLSRFEGQSMFITEALANGKPLILSDGNGMSEMIKDGYNGFVVKTGNPKDAAEKIKKICGLEEKKVKEMGKKSRILYLDKFSEKAVYHQFDDTVKLKS